MTTTTPCQKCGGRAHAGFICKQCIIDLRHQLLGLPTLIQHLADTTNGHTKLSTETSRPNGFSSRTPPTPDQRATTLIEEIRCTLGQWATDIAKHQGYVISPPINWHRPISEYKHTSRDFATFLAARTDVLAKDPDIGELATTLSQYIKRALVIINRRTPPQFCGPCPATINDHKHCTDKAGAPTCSHNPHECATRLMAPRGAVEVRCPTCATTHNVERLVVGLLARADHFRGTISELHRVLRMLGEPVELKTLYRWTYEGKIKPSGYLRMDRKTIGITKRNDDDKPLYRVSDARKHRVVNAARRAENRKTKTG